ncbi:MAG: IS66 family transposase [Rhodobacteraceae bacterium]|jgi:transposase|nr:IS66 family transposase [Paracoccaceae bacterium]MBL4556877.1 IS66 family transposase [Paracoccaceae bacterium]MBL4556935.1 IS66 family transposase [Paracoccaceae bacterium]MBL4559263.1 IS66 family transposase [Paracoccaceae bacterium]
MTDVAAEIEALRAALAEAGARADANAAEAAQAKAAAAHAQALVSGSEALIAHLKLEIEKLRRELYGQRSERKQRLLDQLELQLEEMETTASEDEALAAAAAEKAKTTVGAFQRRKPVRKPFPEHLPRERVVLPAPCNCAACGSSRLTKMGEDITETLEVIPRRWKVIQTVREKFSCRDCERISQPPAPFHPTPRGWAGPSLLAMIIFEKYGQHQPLNRQAERYAREGVELSLSTLADQVGAVAAALAPLHALIEAHVMAAERLHGDDTTVPLLAKGKTETARLWTYVRDDRPFGGPAPPAALFRFSRDRRGAHPRQHLTGWSGVLQADAYAGFNALFAETREPGPILPAFCWAHARRKFFELADIAANARRGKKATPISPLALEAVKRIDAIFDLERAINGLPAEQRLATRKAEIAPLVADLHAWMTAERARLSKHAPVAKAMSYMLPRWDDFARFLDDGRVCLTNNAAERSLRGAALGRKAWLFAGSERGGHRAAFMYTLIVTAKLNGADPQAWLADVLARIASTPMNRLDELLPWNWVAAQKSPGVKAA